MLYGDNGEVKVKYEIDGWHPLHQVALEVEAGRGAANNADYRDIVRTSLLLEARYLCLVMPIDLTAVAARATRVLAMASPQERIRLVGELVAAAAAGQSVRLDDGTVRRIGEERFTTPAILAAEQAGDRRGASVAPTQEAKSATGRVVSSRLSRPAEPAVVMSSASLSATSGTGCFAPRR